MTANRVLVPAATSAGARDPLLSVRNLSVQFPGDHGPVNAVSGVSWDIYPGEVLGVVGESGSGKSVTASSILGLLPASPAQITHGSITYQQKNMLAFSEREWRRIRGREISMIFQDPMTSFNPTMTIGKQIAEAIRVHDGSVSRRVARARAIDLLSLVGVPNPTLRCGQYPHEFSGGMRQRAMIAMAIANRPKLIIADEPTTALDVTIQAQILELLGLVIRETSAAVVFITHDLGVIAELADRVLVMYAGRIVEHASAYQLFSSPRHPYTLGLLGSIPRIDVKLDRLPSIAGQPPTISLSSGCAFQPRCRLSHGRDLCIELEPALVGLGGQSAACHFTDEMDSEAATISAEIGFDVRAGREG